MKLIIEDLQWRYATKRFEDKKISQSDLEIVKRALQLSASSYGLQPYVFYIIENQVIKEKLCESAYGQLQVKECSHLVVFCAQKQVKENDIDLHIQNISKIRGVSEMSLEQYSNMIKSNFRNLSFEEQFNWSEKQVYLALGNLLSACASLKIDACPMETFNSEKYDTILDLKQKGLKSTVLAALGYRSQNDSYQKLIKVRKSFEKLFILV